MVIQHHVWLLSNNNQTANIRNLYFGVTQNKNPEQLQSAEVYHLPERTLAYIRYTGPYQES